jgi:hypothetical protein
MVKFIEDAMKAGWLIECEGVNDDIPGVRVQKDLGGKVTVIDGPFTETKEIIGGYALLSAASKKEAVQHTRRLLDHAQMGTWTIYPLYDMEK